MSTPTIAFTALDPLDSNWREQLEEAIALGFKGVKLYPVLSLFDPLSPDFDEFYRTCTQHGLVLLWHMGATPSPQGRLSISQPLIIEEVAATRITERGATRGDDRVSEAAMEDRKKQGYF